MTTGIKINDPGPLVGYLSLNIYPNFSTLDIQYSDDSNQEFKHGMFDAAIAELLKPDCDILSESTKTQISAYLRSKGYQVKNNLEELVIFSSPSRQKLLERIKGGENLSSISEEMVTPLIKRKREDISFSGMQNQIDKESNFRLHYPDLKEKYKNYKYKTVLPPYNRSILRETEFSVFSVMGT